MKSSFVFLSFVVVTVLIACQALNIPGSRNKFILCLFLFLMWVFFMLDTHYIVNGLYGKMDPDDYIFASMKLFADFILIFGIMSKICDWRQSIDKSKNQITASNHTNFEPVYNIFG